MLQCDWLKCPSFLLADANQLINLREWDDLSPYSSLIEFQFQSRMEDLIKYILLGLLTLPFAALTADALGKTDGMMLRVASGVTAVSALLAVLVGDLGQRPNVTNVVIGAFIMWPFFLLIAKAINPIISWFSIWFSVPIMSWYLTNLSMFFYYPVNGGGGGLGRGLGMLFGWLYMVIPFVPLCAAFLVVQHVTRRIKGETAGVTKR